jgi:hypothetical protein
MVHLCEEYQYKLRRYRGSRTASFRASRESFHVVPWYLELWYKILHWYSVVKGYARGFV